MTQSLILLFGMPRSGTTWLGKIFDSHPDTLYRHEPDSIARITSVPVLPEGANSAALAELRQYAEGIRRNRALKVVGKAPVFPKRYLSGAALQRYRAGITIARFAGRAGLQMSVPWTPVDAGAESTVVWKSIESLGRLGVLVEALPRARALHIVRHPCGYVASVERGEAGSRFGDLVPSSEDYGLLERLLATHSGQAWGLTMPELRDMHPEERLAWRWSVFNDKALAETEDESRVLSFAYERLCASPVAVARELLEHAGLAWDRQVEQFLDSSTSSTDSQYYSVFKDPAVAAWRWQDTLDSVKIERIVGLASRSRTWKELEYGKLTPPEPR